MRLTAHYREYSDSDIYDGDCRIPFETAELVASPSCYATWDVICDFVDCYEVTSIEWSSSSPSEGSWLCLDGKTSYSSSAQYWEVSLHAPLAILRRFHKHLTS